MERRFDGQVAATTFGADLLGQLLLAAKGEQEIARSLAL
jgi:hypothetical protein